MNYHITLRNCKWAARKAGAKRATKLFKIKRAAITFASNIVRGQGGGWIYIHGYDGRVKIRMKVDAIS